jgi:Amt family ammonium transporter
VWSPDGWLCKLGVLDFAGGTVVHISAGVSALVLALLIGPRRDYVPGQASVVPHNLPFTLLGAGLLWFGWFGFNAGSAVGLPGPVAGPAAALAFTTTQTAAAGAALSWLLYEWIRHGKPTSLGLASGIIAGLVAITPAAGFVTPLSALLIGLVSGVVCCVAVSWKARLRYDDSLDAFGVHGVGGMLGAVLTGALCFTPVAASGAQVGKQALGVGVGIATAIVGTLLVTAIVRGFTPLRASDEEERDGLDITTHGERAYHAAIGH